MQNRNRKFAFFDDSMNGRPLTGHRGALFALLTALQCGSGGPSITPFVLRVLRILRYWWPRYCEYWENDQCCRPRHCEYREYEHYRSPSTSTRSTNIRNTWKYSQYQQYSTRKYYEYSPYTLQILSALGVLQLPICEYFLQTNGDGIIEPVHKWSKYTPYSEYTANIQSTPSIRSINGRNATSTCSTCSTEP